MKNIIILTILAILLNSSHLSSQSKSNFLFQPAGANFYVYNRQGSNFFLHQNKITQWNLHNNIRKLSAGKRITRSGDDPANQAVANKMQTLINQLKQESMNDADYRNYMRYYESIVAQNSELLKRIRVLILRSSSGIMGPEERGYNQSEINQLLAQINMNARFSSFNNVRVIPDLTTKNLNLQQVDVVRNLYGSMELVDAALKKLRYLRVKAGTQDNILTFRIKGKSYHYLNLQAAESRISDLNMAEEISNLIKNSTILKTQYGTFMQSKK